MKRIITLLVLSIFTVVSLSACTIGHRRGDSGVGRSDRYNKRRGPPKHAPAYGYQKKYRYRYYPDCEVYYDLGRKLYFYYNSGWWKMSVELPSYGCVRYNHYNNFVIIGMDSSRPEKYHKYTKDRHPGKRHKKSKKKKW